MGYCETKTMRGEIIVDMERRVLLDNSDTESIEFANSDMSEKGMESRESHMFQNLGVQGDRDDCVLL